MKIVINSYQTKNGFESVMEFVKNVGTIINESDITAEYIHNDLDNIYINYKKVLYKFNRYERQFIQKVEDAMDANPFKDCPGINYEGHLFVFNVDVFSA